MPWSEYGTAIRTELGRQTNWPLFIQDYPLFTAISDDDNADAAFAEYLRLLYKRQAPDLMLTIGAPAAMFIQRHRASIFPTVPAVFAAVDQRFVQKDALTDYDTAVPVSIELLPIFQNILRLLPATKLIAVPIGNSPPERLWLNEMQNELKALGGRVVVSYYNDRSFDGMLKIVAALPSDSVIFWPQLRVDGAGMVHEGFGPLQRMYAAANAPIFSYDDVFFKGETVGGPMLSKEEAARKTASVAVQLLAGEKAANFTIEPVRLAPPRYDWRLLQRWHISESSLPSGSEIYFRSPTVWNQYRLPILGTSSVLLLQAALISWLIFEHRRRHRAELRSRNSMAELTYMNRRATAGELSASIAHEVIQPLTGISTRAGAALRWLGAETPDLAKARAALEQILDASHRTADIVTSVRAMFKKDSSKKLPVDINELIRAVLAIVQIDLRRNDVEVRTQLYERELVVEGDKVQLQQVVLNLVMNAIEAMQSVQRRELKVTSGLTNFGRVHLSIEDTGPGIDPSNEDRLFNALFTTKEHGMGMGLSICQSIIEGHDGRIWASSSVTRGSIFQFEIPIMVPDRAKAAEHPLVPRQHEISQQQHAPSA